MLCGRAVAPALFVLLLLGQDSLAGTTGILEGTVRDGRTGEPIPGVSVVLTALRVGAATDSAGGFSIQNIRVGKPTEVASDHLLGGTQVSKVTEGRSSLRSKTSTTKCFKTRDGSG